MHGPNGSVPQADEWAETREPTERVQPYRPVIDAHAHFFPQKMFEAIWNFFESGGWRIAHRGPVDELPMKLIAHGVSAYTVLNYVRRPGQAAALNEWTREFCAAHPGAIPFGTVHAADPDPWAAVAPFLEEHDFRGIKIQPLVCGFGVDDERLASVLDRLMELDKILIVHAGTAPYANEWVGLDRLERVLLRRPRLRTVLPHMGAYDVERAFSMLERFPALYLDTTMIFVNTSLFDTKPKCDPGSIEQYSDRIMFGSDFPNLPYPYTESLASIMRLKISQEARNKIFYQNAARLFGVDEAAT
ncbi:MAG TPA: amidohydrolase family protein [bacterium]|nr:amidohydrolase family protein [bacterium]